MILMKLVGGLGNQMFQYALGRHLSEINHTELKLDTSYLLDRRPRPNVVFRNFDLPVFDMNLQVASADEVAAFTGNHQSLPRRYWHRLTTRINPPNIIREKQYGFDPSVLTTGNHSYLEGYWQSEKYFKAVETIIRSDFAFKTQILEKSRTLTGEIINSNAICLNVRRTDFITVPSSSQGLGFVGLDYYRRAVDQMRRSIENPRYFVFSDDIEWCKENLNLTDPHTFVEHIHAGEKFCNYLQMMTLCKHYIIPNSTFAWWGAWLGCNNEKIVVAPKRWVASMEIFNPSITPAAWHLV